jgi:hypothetical protein
MEAKLVRHNGTTQISINGTVYSPLAFRSFRPEERNVTEFYNSGVRLMSILITGLKCTLDVPYSYYGEIWKGIKQYDFEPIDRQMELFLKNAPEAYFNIMLQFDTRDWYLKENPECTNTFLNLVEMAGYEKWRRDVTEYLQDVIAYIEGKYGERIFCYTMFCGTSTEWYTNSLSYRTREADIRYHPLKEQSFRKYTGDEQATLPGLEELRHTSHGIFRDPVHDERALAYWKFHNNIIGETILYFADVLKKLVRRIKLTGLYYGYLMQLKRNRLLCEGHMGYEQVWKCPDIDMIFEPAAYGATRLFEGVSGFLHTVDSVELHHKLTFHEVDHTTYIAPQTVENGRMIPGAGSKLKDEFDSRMVLRREFVLCQAKRTGMWWFDFFGGYYYAKELMDEVEKMMNIDRRTRTVPMQSVAEIAVFGDVDSMYYVSEYAGINEDCLHNMRDIMGRMGAPYDIYTFSDLTRVNFDRYKLCIFLNTFKISEEARNIIEKKVKRDGRSMLWLYAPDYITDSGFSTGNMSRITGMKLETAALKNSEVVSDGERFAFTEAISPLFKVADENVSVLGVYAEDNSTAFASRKFDSHTSYYCAVGNLPHNALRRIAKAAGVHIYFEGDDPVYVNNRLLGIHAVKGGEITLNLPFDTTAEELFDGGTYISRDKKITVRIPKGEMKLYLLGQ